MSNSNALVAAMLSTSTLAHDLSAFLVFGYVAVSLVHLMEEEIEVDSRQ